MNTIAEVGLTLGRRCKDGQWQHLSVDVHGHVWPQFFRKLFQSLLKVVKVLYFIDINPFGVFEFKIRLSIVT